MAPWAVAAAVACFFCRLAGSAAAGIAEFLGGRAFIPVAFTLFMVFVDFATCAGMSGAVCTSGYRLILVGFVCSRFGHMCHQEYGFPYYNYSYEHNSFKGSHAGSCSQGRKRALMEDDSIKKGNDISALIGFFKEDFYSGRWPIRYTIFLWTPDNMITGTIILDRSQVMQTGIFLSAPGSRTGLLCHKSRLP